MYSNNVELDKFYTKENIAIECLKYLNLNEYDFIIEPSAGSGNFYNNINFDNKIGLDIKPDNNNIFEKDWFEYQIDSKYKNVLIIGNPPFGKRNKLSLQFIQHAQKFQNVKTIAFILPNVYKKHTLQKYINNSFRIKNIIELKNNSFEINGQEYHVPCSFFIFDKSDGIDLRFKKDLYIETNDWFFSNKNNYDFFVMGSSPKNIKLIPETTNRGYYIKIKENSFEKIDEIINNFKKIDWYKNSNSSVNGGVAWFTKFELVKIYLDN